MTKFIALLLTCSLFLGSFGLSSSHAQTAAKDIQQAQDYLQGLSTVKANFIQKAYNGSRLSGTFYLNRPGKLRFEYNEVDDFIVADGIFIYFYDAELQEQTNAPIGQTMADFLLRKNLSLKEDVTVQKIDEEEGFKTMTIVEKGDAASGSIKLFFNQEPYALTKWQVIDAAGLTTEILLQDMERDLDLPARLFAYLKPKQDKPTYN